VRCVSDLTDQSREAIEARRAAEAEVLAEAVESVGAVDVLPKSPGREKIWRYLHASIRLPSDHRRFRLKVVNTTRSDAESIRLCCRNANHVHSGLVRQLGREIGFRVPQWHPVPENLESSLYIVEEIEDTAPSLDTTGGLAGLVDQLVRLEVETRDFDAPLRVKPPWIQSCNRSGYRARLLFSLRGLLEREEIALQELYEVVARFDGHWAPSLPLDSGRCLSHGDFSRGNVRGGEGLWLIDFEHSHVGAPVLDMAHLFVNLLFDDCSDTARQLREQYDALRGERGLRPLPGVFGALFLERVAGKWNAMKAPTAERRGRIRSLLLLHLTE